MYFNNIKVIGVNKIIHSWRDHLYRTSRVDKKYSNNTFPDIKLKYFLQKDYNKEQQLILWSAGKKGKIIAKYLIKNNIEFSWATENPNKIGKNIYGKIIVNSKIIFNTEKSLQVIIAIASKEFNPFINKYSNYSIYKFC